MKRYKDCMLVCLENQTPSELLDVIEIESKKQGYEINRYSTMGTKDTLSVYINKDNLPISRLVLSFYSEERGVSIINIVPMPESGVSHIEPIVYNQLLDVFKKDVFLSIQKTNGNEIEGNKEDYTIEELIPKSFPELNTWLSNFPLSAHPLDTHRWYDFVIALRRNGEHLAVDDLGKYIKEKYDWSDDDINTIELRLESHLDLLEYYDDHR